jgi:sugar diacid utilization regulator
VSTGLQEGAAAVADVEPVVSVDPGAPGRTAARTFGEVLLAADGPRGVEDLLRPAAAALAGALGVRRCTFYLRDGRTGTFRGRIAFPRSSDPVVRRLTMGGPTDALTADALAASTAVSVPDVTRDPRTARSAVRDQKVRSVLVVPIVADGPALGVAYLDDLDRRHDFAPDARATATVFGRLLGQELDRVLRAGQLAATQDQLARERSFAPRLAQAELRLATGGDTVDELVRTVATIVGRPVDVLAGDGTLLARASTDGGPASPSTPERSIAVMRALEDQEPGVARVVDPDLRGGLTHRCVAAPCVLSDGGRGLVVVTELGVRLTPFDHLMTLRAAAAVTAIGRSPSTRPAASRNDDRSVVLAHLLGTPLADRSARTIAAAAGVDVDARRVVVALHPDLEPHVPTMQHGLLTRRATFVVLPDVLALVVEVDADGRSDGEVALHVRDEVAAALSTVGGLTERSATFGVSQVCTDAAGLPRALRLSRRLQQVGRVPDGGRTPKPTGTTVGELGPGMFLLVDPQEGARLATELLGPVLDPDPSMADLLATMRTFCGTGASIRATAAAHAIHDNTVRHRFGRVQTLTGLDIVGNVDDLLVATMSLAALRLAEPAGPGRRPTGPPPEHLATPGAVAPGAPRT